MEKLFATLAFCTMLTPALAEPVPVDTSSYAMKVGQTQVFRTAIPFTDIAMAKDEIVNVLPTTDHRFLVQARNIGETSIVFLDEKGLPVEQLNLQVVAVPEALNARQVRVYYGIPDSRDGKLSKTYWCARPAGCLPDPENFAVASSQTNVVVQLPNGGGQGKSQVNSSVKQ